MLWATDSATRCHEHDEQPTYEEQALEDQLAQEQFDNELENDLEVMLTQEQCDEQEGGAEGRAGEAAEGEEEEDDDDLEEGYESSEDPFPYEARRRPTEEDLDKDFDPNEEVGKSLSL